MDAGTETLERRRFFADLVDSGRFCRDTAVGRMLHPGSESLREISDGDSLHVCVDPDGTVSVHVDHFSPVAGATPCGECRYTVRAVVSHVAAHLAEQWRRLRSGTWGAHRCRLECELVEVDVDVDEEPEAAAEAVAALDADHLCEPSGRSRCA